MPPKKGASRLVGPGPSVPPGGLMVAPESKEPAKVEEEFSLSSAIASLSPWAQTASAAVPLDEDTGEANPEHALAMFVAQTQGLDRDALLARVAEAASKEADAVTKLGQLTFKLAAKEKLMDDLRAGLVAAGRAVSEAQQEADAVKRNVASQEAALAGRSGASVDVLRRLGEVSAKLEQKETQLENLKAELALARKSSEESGVQVAVLQKTQRSSVSDMANALAAAKKAAMSREVELNAALAAAKAAAQKAMASAAAARAERTSDIVDVLSAKETQVEGLLSALDAIKVGREMMASEGVPEEDKEEVAEKDELIKALLSDLAKENGWRQAVVEMMAPGMEKFNETEVRELREALEKAERQLGMVPRAALAAAASGAQGQIIFRSQRGGAAMMSRSMGAGKVHVDEVGAYNLDELDTLREALASRERELGQAVTSVQRMGATAVASFSADDVLALRAALASREKELGLEPSTVMALTGGNSVGGGVGSKKELDKLKGELSGGSRKTFAAIESALAAANAANAERAELINELQNELDTLLDRGAPVGAGGSSAGSADYDAFKKIAAKREELLNNELSSLRKEYESARSSHSSAITSREALIDSLKSDFNAARRRLAELEKESAQLRRAEESREATESAKAASAKAAAEAEKIAHSAQVNAKEAAIEALRADLAAARRAVASAEADIVSLKKGSTAREQQLQGELAAARRSYEVLKLAAAAGKPLPGGESDSPKAGAKAAAPAAAAANFRPGEMSAQLAAREAQVESLRAELLAVRRAVSAAEEEAQSRRESAAALESELSTELSAAKAAHEAAELAAAELATNAAANAQNAAKMMQLLSEQLGAEREARRVLESELRSAMDAHPDLPRISFPLPPLPPAKKESGVLHMLKGAVLGGAAAVLLSRTGGNPLAAAATAASGIAKGGKKARRARAASVSVALRPAAGAGVKRRR